MPTLLEQTLSLDILRLAWNAVEENQGAGGVDCVSLKTWRRTWEERLVKLAAEVRANTYKPLKFRLRKISKQNRREFRLLRIPTITDRVLQRAILQVLHPVFEPRFMDCSFGYRPRRSLSDAVQRILLLRENGYRWVLDADIDEFFDSVDHAVLLDFLRHYLPDDSLLPLITRWLKIGRADPRRAMGIPLGSPLSPLWANVILHRLDIYLTQQGWQMVRYADDFIVFAKNRPEIKKAYADVEKTLATLRLRYEASKTCLTSFEEGFDFIGVRFQDDEYSYIYMDKEIKVSGNEVDWLFSHSGLEY